MNTASSVLSCTRSYVLALRGLYDAAEREQSFYRAHLAPEAIADRALTDDEYHCWQRLFIDSQDAAEPCRVAWGDLVRCLAEHQVTSDRRYRLRARLHDLVRGHRVRLYRE